MSDMRFFSGRPLKGEEAQENGLIKVLYSDDKKPAFELVSKEEFDTYIVTRDVESQPSELEKNRQTSLQKATYQLQSRLMKEVENYNPRWLEIGQINKRIDSAAGEMKGKLFNAMFSKKQWEYELTFADVFNKLISPDWAKAPQEVQSFFASIMEQKLKVAEFELLSNAIMALISSFQKQVIEQEFNQPYETLRLGDLIAYIEAHSQKDSLGESQPETSNDGDDSLGKEQTSGEQTSEPSSDKTS